MSKLTFDSVWKHQDQMLTDEIIATWNRLGVLPPGVDGRIRAQQVVFVVRNEARKIVGISTAYHLRSEQLRSPMLAFRAMLDPDYRIPGLLQKLFNVTFDQLEMSSYEMFPRPLGVIVEVENPNLLKVKKAVTSTGLTFIGFSPKGFPIRVKYFRNAQIDYDLHLSIEE